MYCQRAETLEFVALRPVASKHFNGLAVYKRDEGDKALRSCTENRRMVGAGDDGRAYNSPRSGFRDERMTGRLRYAPAGYLPGMRSLSDKYFRAARQGGTAKTQFFRP